MPATPEQPVGGRADSAADRGGDRCNRRILESIVDYGVIALDLDGRVTRWNEGAHRILGWTEAEMLGRDAGCIFTPEDRRAGRLDTEMRRALDDGHGGEDCWHLRKTGERFWATGRLTPLRDEGGDAVGFVKVLRDRTEQRQAVEALRESEEFQRFAAEAGGTGSWSLDLATGSWVLSPVMAALMGFPGGRTTASADEWRRRIAPADRDAVDAALAAAVDHDVPFDVEFRTAPQGGGERWLHAHGAVIRDGAGRAPRIHGIAIDDTGRRQAQGRHAALVELGDRFRALDDPVDLSYAAAEILGRTLGASMAGYGTIDPVAETITIARDWTAPGVGSIAGRLRFRDYGSYIEDLKRGETVVFADAEKDPRTTATAAGALKAIAAQAAIAIPITERGGFVALLYATQATAREWTAGEIAFVRDIAERTRIAVERRRAEQDLRALAESLEQEVVARTAERDRLWDLSEDLLVVASHDGRLLRVSPSWTRRLGHEQADLLTRPYADLIHPDDLGAVMDALASMRATGRPSSFENRVRTADGGWRWVSWTLSPEPGGARLTGVGRDITATMEAAATLRRSEARLRSIFETSYQYQGLLALDGTVLDSNATSLAGIGARLEDVLGRPFWETPWFAGTPGLPDAVRAGVAAVAGGDTLRREIVINLRDGRRRFDFTMRPVRDEHGAVVAIVPEAVDITERRQAEEALSQAQKMEAIGQLTGGVAHDFNNLLTIIRSATDFLGRRNLTEERRRRYVDAIAETVDRGSRLTGQLLAFARRQALAPEVFEVGVRIRSVADMLRTILGSRITLDLHLPEHGLHVKADVSHFETALVNIVVNARDAMDGVGRLTIAVGGADAMPDGTAAAGGPYVSIALTDTGTGIAGDRLGHIFEPFFTTKEVGKGTGLGLSQVYGFAKQSGGDVAVESEVGRGTTFTLFLPMVAAAEVPEVEDAHAPAHEETGGGRRVLVVEDNAEIGRFSTQILQDLGYETTWAMNAEEALGLLERDTFDVVFSDVVMPGMSGVELGREIRRRDPRLPVVLTSGYSEVIAEKGRHGFELLQKPYAAEELSAVLRRVARAGRVG